MNPLSASSALIKAITFPFTFIFVVGLCYFINWMTSPSHWWAQWVAFGMGIALLCVWARAFKVLALSALAAGIAYVVYRFSQRTNQGTK
jgi:hypothetical protein